MNTIRICGICWLSTLCLVVACTPSDADTAPVCTAGDTQSCVCTNGASGEQACADDDSTWLPCECAIPEPQDVGGQPDTAGPPDVPLPPPVDTGTKPPTPPTGNNACEVDADCESKCPSDATMGCKCMTNQQGVKRCMAQCETADDCPTHKNPEITLGCNPNGVCTKKAGEEQNPDPPEENASVLANCQNQVDCQEDGACPTDAPIGCSCIETKNGNQKCIPLCDVDSDCPSSLSIDMVCGTDEGHCIPDNSGARPGPD